MSEHVKTVIKISKMKPEEIEMVLDMTATPMCAPAPDK